MSGTGGVGKEICDVTDCTQPWKFDCTRHWSIDVERRPVAGNIVVMDKTNSIPPLLSTPTKASTIHNGSVYTVEVNSDYVSVRVKGSIETVSLDIPADAQILGWLTEALAYATARANLPK